MHEQRERKTTQTVNSTPRIGLGKGAIYALSAVIIFTSEGCKGMSGDRGWCRLGLTPAPDESV